MPVDALGHRAGQTPGVFFSDVVRGTRWKVCALSRNRPSAARRNMFRRNARARRVHPRRREPACRSRRACVGRCTRDVHRASKSIVLKTSALANTTQGRGQRPREPGGRRGHIGRAMCAREAVPLHHAAAFRVLTAKKTVIRFRHNNRWSQQRVSANPATTCNTTQSSARKVVMVDSGVVSLAKAPDGQGHATRGAERSGFFSVEVIRFDAPGASAVDRGSDTRGAFRTGQ